MEQAPRVTVIVPNYNHERFLEERIECIRAQTYTDWEVVLLDDASTDGSANILRTFAPLPGFRLIENATNSGSPFAQWNRGVELARGELIWIAESDDVARPRFLEQLVSTLEAHPSAGLAYCASIKINADGEELGPLINDALSESDRKRWTRDFTANGTEEIRQSLYRQNTIPSASAVVFRKSIYLAAGEADPGFRLSGDWWQWMRMLQHGDLCFVAEPLNLSRFHPDSQRSAGARSGAAEVESLRVQRLCRRMLTIERTVVRAATGRVATSWLQGIRSGRYRGSLFRHFTVLAELLRADVAVALRFLLRLPYCLLIWILKRTLFRGRSE